MGGAVISSSDSDSDLLPWQEARDTNDHPVAVRSA
jgi:hypothetical protein